jgi:hypothetical protein
MPDGYIVLGRERGRDPVPVLLGWTQVATTEADRLIELYDVFVRTPIADPEVRLEQARAWRRLGFLYFESDRYADTDRAMREAEAAAAEVLASRPDEARYRTELAVCRADAALYRYVIARKTPASWQDLTAARERLVELAEGNPADPEPPSELGRLDHKIGYSHPTQRLTYYTSAIAWQKKALALADTPTIRFRLNRHYAQKLFALVSGRDGVAISALLADWADVWPDSAEHALMTARVAAYVAQMRPSPAVTARCHDRAADLFGRWVRLGGRDPAALEQYARTPGLGDRPDFKALLARLKPEPVPAPRRVP